MGPKPSGEKVESGNPMVEDGPAPTKVKYTDGRRNSRGMKRRRPVDLNRRSLQRLTNVPLTEVEKKTLPPLPYNERKMTDVLFLILFLTYWIGMVIIGALGFKYGNPASLIYGRDSDGRVCGDANEGFINKELEKMYPGVDVNYDMSDKPFIIYPRVEKDLQFNYVGFEINLNPFDVDFFRVCASECPNENDLVCTEEAEAVVRKYMDNHADDNRTREEVIRACVDDPNVRLGDAENPNCINNLIAKQCFETFFNQTSFLFRCFPQYVYEVEVVEEETGCVEYQNVSVVSGRVIEDCVKFKEVTRVTKIEPPDTNVVFEAFNTVSRVFDRLLGDVIKAKKVIIGTGLGVATATGLLYILALRYFVAPVIWGTIFFAVATMIGLTLFCYVKAGLLTRSTVSTLSSNVDDFLSGVDDRFNLGQDGDYEYVSNSSILDSGEELPGFISQSDDFSLEFKWTGYVMTVLTLTLMFIVFTSIERINRAVEFFKEASRCITANPFLILVPPMTLCVSILVMSYYVAATLYITSAGTIDNGTLTLEFLESRNISAANEILNTKVFGPIEYSSLLNVYLMIGFFWSMAFVHGVSLMTASGVVAKWYWNGSTSSRNRGSSDPNLGVSHFGVFQSFTMITRFHLGTAAFGSMLLSFVQMVRYVASFIQARLNKTQQNNSCVRLLFWSMECCLKCAENCVKFISYNAYIMVVLYGTSFCTSTKLAFQSFAYNLVQVATVTFLGDVILRFGQLFIVFTSAFIAYVTLDGSREFQIGGEKELSSILFPVFITAMMSYFVAREVLAIYHIAIDTILLSYCQDKKLLMQKGVNRDLKADKNMQEFVDKHKPNEEDFATQRSLEVYA